MSSRLRRGKAGIGELAGDSSSSQSPASSSRKKRKISHDLIPNGQSPTDSTRSPWKANSRNFVDLTLESTSSSSSSSSSSIIRSRGNWSTSSSSSSSSSISSTSSSSGRSSGDSSSSSSVRIVDKPTKLPCDKPAKLPCDKPAKLSYAEEDRSNLTGIIPEKGMRVEIRDLDWLWSPATVESVTKNEDSKDSEYTVSIRYDGWGPAWDEEMTWPNIRLSRIFTYTKEVKCFVDCLPKRGTKAKCRGARAQHSNTLWPCKVQFRMPHPGCSIGVDFLKLEKNIFVMPYGDQFPHDIKARVQNGGIWLHHNRLRGWKDDLRGFLHQSPLFKKAWEMAMQDEATEGKLPIKTFEEGTLLRDVYRTKNLGGDSVNGRMYYGGFASDHPVHHSANKNLALSVSDDSSISVNSRHETDDKEKMEYEPPRYEPPPLYPPPVRITDPIYPNDGIRRLENVKKWTATVSMSGNNLLLGSYSSQTQALQAKKIALASQVTENNTQSCTAPSMDDKNWRGKDPRELPLELIVTAVEKQWDPANNFSIGEWTAQLIRHQNYQKEMKERKTDWEQQQKTEESKCSPSKEDNSHIEAKKDRVVIAEKVISKRKQHVPCQFNRKSAVVLV